MIFQGDDIIEKELEELVDDLKLLFDENEIGVIAHQNWNRADYLQCPCCCRKQDEKGNLSGIYPMYSIEHDKDCRLNNLYLKVEKLWRESDD